MSRQQQGQDGDTHDDAIPAKGFEPVFRDETDEKLNGQHGHHKRHYIAHEQGRQVVDDNLRAAVHEKLQHLIAHGGKHGGHGQEERELGGSLTRQLLRHAAHDGGHGARHARYHRDALEHAYPEGTPLCQLGLFAAFIEYTVAEQHEHTAHDEHHGYHDNTLQHGVDEVTAQQAQHRSRDESHQQLPIEVVLVQEALQRGSSLGCRRVVQPEEPFPIEHHYRQDGAELYNKGERLDKLRTLHAQDVLRDNHVARGRDRQELRQSLYDGNNNGFPNS